MNNRYDFIFIFDVKDGNPNGDPDAGNLPRMDPETSQGLVSDVCIKRKVRNYLIMCPDRQKGNDIYIKEKAILNNIHKEAYIATGNEQALSGNEKKRKGSADTAEQAQKWLCENYYDIRTFGAVMSTGVNCGQVRGPVQLTISRSVDPIDYQDLSITRCAVATEEESEKQSGDNRTMGLKSIVPYGLYVGHGFVSPFFAHKTGFKDNDLETLWKAFKNMFDLDHSAARGEMTLRKLIIFRHDSELGNAPAHDLFERLTISKQSASAPRSYSDYKITLNTQDLPQGVTLDENSIL